MSGTHIRRTTPIIRSPRVMQVEGIFDLPATQASELSWDVHLPLDEQPWNIGLIVGPSGAGKSTIARDRWPQELDRRFDWPADRSILDGFPADMSVRDVTGLLSSVGFSSPPAWLRPFGVLSNGEQFRVTVARHLAETAPGQVAVIDEFTSVVDRTVAQIGSAAVAKTVRRRGQQLVAVGCHYDVVEWLQPDWIYEPHTGQFTWRSVQPRPGIDLELVPADYDLWRVFGPHHYLSNSLNKAAHCYVGLVDGVHPAVFIAMLPLPNGPVRNAWRISRQVCLPDYQGVGLGNGVAAHIAGAYKAAGRRVYITTGHPANSRALARSPLWRLRRAPGLNSKLTEKLAPATAASDRFTSSFLYAGPAVPGTLADRVLARIGPPKPAGAAVKKPASRRKRG